MLLDKSILYSSIRSPHCLKVAIFLQEKNIPFDRVEIDLSAKEQRTPEFLAINPLGLVPVYEDNNGIHPDSLYIMQYLEEQYPDPPLFPKDQTQLQKAFDWIDLSSTTVRDVSHHLYWQLIEPPETGTNQQLVKELEAQGAAILHQLEELFSKTTYFMGETLSVVDIAMLPWIYGYQRFNFPFSQRYQNVLKWLTTLSKQPSFQDNYNKRGRPFFDDST